MPAPPFFGSVNDCINQAYVNAGLLAEGQVPSGEKYAAALNRLNHLVNYLQTKGLKLFTLRDVPITLVAGINLYPQSNGVFGVSPLKPLRVVFAYYLDQYNNRVPMTALSWQEWTVLPVNNTSPSQPVNYFVDKKVVTLDVYVWPTPDANAALGTVHLVLQEQVQNPMMLTEAIHFPTEWFLGISWALADELATGQPAAITQTCAAKRKQFLEDLEGWDVEDAVTFFTPDVRMSYSGNSFR